MTPPPSGARLAPIDERFRHWISTAMARDREYASVEIAGAAGLRRNSLGAPLRAAVAERLLQKFQEPGYFPSYAHPDYVPPLSEDEIRARVLALLARVPQGEHNRLALVVHAELNQTTAELRPYLLELAAQGRLHAYTYPDDPDEWYSATPPARGRGGRPLRDGSAR